MALPLVENEEEAGKYVPIFSRALEGSFIATSHLSAAFRKNIRTMVLLSCGNYQSTLDSRTSILITKRNEGAKYFAAARANIPSVTPQWIRDVFRTSTFLNPGNYLVPPFSKLVFCATGFTRDERQKLQLKIGLSGGSWSPELKRSVTHLIVDFENQDNNSKKLKYALQWGVKIVSHAWVRACIENGFYCPTDDSTKGLYPPLQSINADSANTTNNPSPNTSDGDEKIAPIPAVSTFARYAGLTPAPAPVSRDTSTVTSEESDPNTTSHSSWMNGSNIGNTPFRKVSVRQSHLDLRSTLNNRRKGVQQSTTVEYDELEGDRPDDVDTDSEDEAVLAPSQQPTTSSTKRDTHQAEQQSSRTDMAAKPPSEPPKRVPNTHIDSASLYEELDRQTQEQLVSHALDVYFKGPIMDENDAHEAQQNDQHLLEGSKSFHFFEGVTISIIGVPRKEEYAALDDRMKKQLEELESAEQEFIERGGSLALPTNSNRILVFNPSLITRQEYAVIRDKEVLSSDWLTDSILLELVQSPETYRLMWSSEKHLFQSMTPKFWTSSCVIGSEKTISPKSETLSSARPHFARSSITIPEKDLPKPAPPVQPPTSNSPRESAGEMLTLNKRHILPPTSISASHLLLKSALHVNTLRKMDKIQRDGKKNAKNRDNKLHRDSHEHHRKASSTDDIRDPTHSRAHTTKPSHERQKSSEVKTIKSKPSSSSHITTSRSGNGPIFDKVQHMDVTDLNQKLEQRKVGLSMESESDSDSIVGSPLTISAKMQSSKKRKPSPTHEKPLLDVQGVKRWKAAESMELTDIHALPPPPTTTITTEELIDEAITAAVEPTEAKHSQDSNPANIASIQSDPMDSLHASYRSPMPSSFMSEHEHIDIASVHHENDTPVEGMVDFLTQTMRGDHIKALPPKDAEHLRSLEHEKSSSNHGTSHHDPLNDRPAHPSSKMDLDDEESSQPAPSALERAKSRLVTIQALTPSSGPKKGGDNVIVTLDRVEPQMKVVFGTVEAETISHPTMARLWATAPPSAIALPVLISIIDGFGHKANSDLRRFEYSYL